MHSVFCILCLCPALCAAIEFPDSSLEAKVRQALGKESGALRPDDFDGLHHFEADRKGIAILSGIAHLHDVELLQLANNGIADLAPLANLQHLQKCLPRPLLGGVWKKVCNIFACGPLLVPPHVGFVQ